MVKRKNYTYILFTEDDQGLLFYNLANVENMIKQAEMDGECTVDWVVYKVTDEDNRMPFDTEVVVKFKGNSNE